MKKKVLILKLGAMGDVIHSTVIASAIKQSHPNWQVDFLASDIYAEIIKNHPHIDNVIYWDVKKRKSYRYLFKVAFELFKIRYDYVFNLTRASRNNLLSFLAFPKVNVGKKSFDKSWVEEYFLTAKSVIKDIEMPKRLYLGKPDCKTVNDILQEQKGPFFIFSPGGASNKNRQGRIWNIKKWKELCEKINEEYSGTIFVCGAENEREKHLFLENSYTKVLTGKLNTEEMSHLISEMDIMISSDSGPAHVASAHNVKTLVLLGSTSPDKIQPYGEKGYYISSKNECRFCWKKKCPYLKENELYTPCMEAISVEEVFQKVKEIL